MVKIELGELKPDQYITWDSFIDKSQYGTVFHYSDWIRISAKYQNSDFKIFGFYIDDELIGGCPLYFSKSYMLLKHVTTISPSSPFSGFIFNLPQYNQGDQYSIKNKIYADLLKEINIGIFDSVTIANSPNFNDIRYFTWRGWSNIIRYTYCIDLQNYENPIFISNMEKKINEYHITIEESKDLDSFYTLYQATWHRRGQNVPISEPFINDIFHAFERKNRIKMLVGVSNTGKIAAANIILVHPNCIYAWIAATDNELWKTGVHYAMYSHIIQYYKNIGYSSFDIMMANTKNLVPFAHCFNPRLVPFFIVEKRGVINNVLSKIFFYSQKKFNEF